MAVVDRLGIVHFTNLQVLKRDPVLISNCVAELSCPDKVPFVA